MRARTERETREPAAGAVIRREWSSARRAAASLPADLIEEGARRLRRLQLAGATAVVILLATNLWAATRPGWGRGIGALAIWGAAGVLVVVVGMFVLTHLPGIDAGWLLDRTLVIRVVMSLFLAIFFHSLPVDPDRYPTGFSPVAIWIIVTTIIVPATPGKTSLSIVAAALMDPLGLLVNVAAGVPAPSPRTLVGLFLPTVLSASFAIVLARVLYNLSLDVAEARDMGSYRLAGVLGRGGMGEVWRAEHRMLARPAAVKIIRPDASGSFGPDVVRRFEREARATAALRSPHTVQLYDFGVAADGSLYYAMELLEGLTLDALVERFGPVPPERAVHLLRQACRSLEEAHAAGLVHRDIKPSNLFLCPSGAFPDFVKVLDFGLVKNVTGSHTRLTATGEALGTPSTMPPEVALGKDDLDGRADLYSLGCVAYTLLTGSTVFGKAPPLALVHDHASTPPVPLSHRAAQKVPRELEDVVMDCLEKEPAARPANARELFRRLGAVPLESAWTDERAEEWWNEHATTVLAEPTLSLSVPPSNREA